MDPNQFNNRTERKRFFESELFRAAPRLLSRMDRCPVSASSGCLDREYWAWASKDFANLDMQRGLRVLAYLWVTDFPGNGYLRQRALLDWICLGVSFWVRRQYRDGSFDHLYAYERSWMAAAFTLTDMVATYRMVQGEIRADLGERWLAAMERAGECLIRRGEEHGFISNHRAGAAAGLMGLFNLTGRRDFQERAWDLLGEVFSRQSSEGWFLEYEGADPGYQTLSIHYLALAYLESERDPRILDSVHRALAFLAYFLHPDGSIGGEYGSRNCPHFFPGGMEIFAQDLPLAEAMARRGVWGLAAGSSCGMADADGRNEVPLATSYVLAHQALCDPGAYRATLLPSDRLFERVWKEAGIYVRSEPNHYLVFGASKGGVLKLFDKDPPGRLIFSSCGYAGRLKGHRDITTLLWTSSPEIDPEGLEAGKEHPLNSSRQIRIQAHFYLFRNDRLMSPWRFLLFRVFNLTAGRLRPIHDFVRKRVIIGRFLKARKRAGVTLRRTLIWDLESPRIEDQIVTAPGVGVQLVELREHGFFSTVYMASARYFRTQDFQNAWSGEELASATRDGQGSFFTRPLPLTPGRAARE